MTEISPEVLGVLKKFAADLKGIEEAVAEFVNITPEQQKALTPLERARRDVAAASFVNSLYCMHASTLGRDPEKEDMVGVEQRKIKEVVDRLDEIEQRPFRPTLNKRAAKSFIRNALYEIDEAGKQMADRLAENFQDDEEWNEDENDTEGSDEQDEQDETCELEDNF